MPVTQLQAEHDPLTPPDFETLIPDPTASFHDIRELDISAPR